jgi:hypothetical protein
VEPTADLLGRQYREALFDNRVLTHLSGLEQCLRYGPLEAPRTDVCHGDLTCSTAVGLGAVSRPGARVGFAGLRDAGLVGHISFKGGRWSAAGSGRCGPGW